MIFLKKKSLNIKFVFWFSLQRLSETLRILKRTEGDVIRMLGFLVKLPSFMSHFNETWNFLNSDSYVYWNMHHLYSSIKIDQLDVTCFIISLFTAQHVSNVSTSIFRSLRLISWVMSWVEWYPDAGFSLHPDTTPTQPNHNVTPTHIVPEQYNPWNDSTNESQAPEDRCINIRNMLSIK